jgi:dTDP-4-dehydrorhamnose reductase
MKVLVVGASGQLGAAVVHEFGPHADVVASGRGDLDITDDAGVRARVVAESPDVIINCAAYNFVDAAEDDPVTALNVNALGPRALARAAMDADATLIHVGSDFVFDGRATEPYRETDAANPQSVYAWSKLLGEWFAVDVRKHYVFRVESLFGRAPGGLDRGSAATILERIQSGEQVRIFVDRIVSPTHVADAAAAMRVAVAGNLPFGLYHCVNSGHCTWWEFAEEAARLIGCDARLVPVTMADVPMRAARPKYSALANAKLTSLGVPLPDWRDALRRVVG